MSKIIDTAKAAEYDATIAALPNTRESAKAILDMTESDYILIVDHPYENSMTVATHMTVSNIQNAVCNLIGALTEDETSFPPLPAALLMLGVTEEQAKLIVVTTTILDRLGLTPKDVEVIAGIIQRKTEAMAGPSSIEV